MRDYEGLDFSVLLIGYLGFFFFSWWFCGPKMSIANAHWNPMKLDHGSKLMGFFHPPKNMDLLELNSLNRNGPALNAGGKSALLRGNRPIREEFPKNKTWKPHHFGLRLARRQQDSWWKLPLCGCDFRWVETWHRYVGTENISNFGCFFFTLGKNQGRKGIHCCFPTWLGKIDSDKLRDPSVVGTWWLTHFRVIQEPKMVWLVACSNNWTESCRRMKWQESFHMCNFDDQKNGKSTPGSSAVLLLRTAALDSWIPQDSMNPICATEKPPRQQFFATLNWCPVSCQHSLKSKILCVGTTPQKPRIPVTTHGYSIFRTGNFPTV